MANLKLIGSKLTKVNAERNINFDGKLKVNTSIKIVALEKVKDLKDTIKVGYEFWVNYLELGKIDINGWLFLSGESKIIKSLEKSFKEKNFDSAEYLAISNLIIQKASIKAFELEEELGLPIHIKLPTLSLKK